MDAELSYFLTKRYPKIFISKRQSEDFSWAFECDSGWFHILNNMCFLIQNHIDQDNERFEKNTQYQSYIDNAQLDKLPNYLKHKAPDYNLDLSKPCPQFVAQQIKEKFGTLRVYHMGNNNFFDAAVSFAQNMSACICEVCGNEGKLTNSGFLKTLCEKHTQHEDTKEDKEISNYLNVLYLGNRQNLEIKHQISETEAICVDKDNNQIHTVKISHPKITFWYGKPLEN